MDDKFKEHQTPLPDNNQLKELRGDGRLFLCLHDD